MPLHVPSDSNRSERKKSPDKLTDSFAKALGVKVTRELNLEWLMKELRFGKDVTGSRRGDHGDVK